MLLALSLSAQKLSNYEKYWQAREDSIAKSQTTLSQDTTEKQISSTKPEYDDLYYQPNKDVKKVKHAKRKVVVKDTLTYVVDSLVNQNSDISVNYFDADPFFYSYNIGRFYHGGFNYWMYGNPWYYNDYWMYDPYDWYWESRFMWTNYFSWGWDNFYFGYHNWNPWRYGHHYNNNGWNNNNKWYTNNHNWNSGNHGVRKTPWVIPNNNQVNNRKITSVQQSQQKRTVSPTNKVTYQENRRTYTPSYSNPRASTRPQYNNTKGINTMPQRRVETSTQRSTSSTQRIIENRRATMNSNREVNTQRSTPNIQRSTQSHSYSAPTRNSSTYSPSTRSFSQPSSNYNSGSVSRSSSYSSGSNFSNSSNSGGGSRSSTGSSGTSATRR